MKSIIFIGTRPEAIKLVPLYKKFKQSKKSDVLLVSTGQHKEMVSKIFSFFDVVPDIEFDLMTANQSLADIFSRVLSESSRLIEKEKPDVIFVQGDTNTALASALAAFYTKINIAHVEAGLRTYEFYSPFPEEKNRELISRISSFHFTPTSQNKENLIKEGIPSEKIFTVGNTVIDALQESIPRINSREQENYFINEFSFNPTQSKYVLITGHRRENFGDGINQICKALLSLSKKHPDCNFVYPVHLNPNILSVVKKLLGGLQNIFLLPPLSYDNFLFLMLNCHLILTDSGGIQEEAPTLNKPVLLMRASTERPEGVESGAVRIVGAEANHIIKNVDELMTNSELYSKMTNIENPYGDGTASIKIFDIINKKFI
jgi:UDP-N-acetylglucosamine 2-epimerase (non-hydrolysing)